MKVPLAVKVSLLVALSAVTAFTTSSVVAWGQHRRARRPDPTSARPANAGASDAAKIAMKIVPGIAEAAVPGPVTAGGTMHKLNVEVVGDLIRVAASASVVDTRLGMRYVWSLRLLHPGTKKLVFEKRYMEQMFEAPQGLQLHPTFEGA